MVGVLSITHPMCCCCLYLKSTATAVGAHVAPAGGSNFVGAHVAPAGGSNLKCSEPAFELLGVQGFKRIQPQHYVLGDQGKSVYNNDLSAYLAIGGT